MITKPSGLKCEDVLYDALPAPAKAAIRLCNFAISPTKAGERAYRFRSFLPSELRMAGAVPQFRSGRRFHFWNSASSRGVPPFAEIWA